MPGLAAISEPADLLVRAEIAASLRESEESRFASRRRPPTGAAQDAVIGVGRGQLVSAGWLRIATRAVVANDGFWVGNLAAIRDG
jgi:hypothetical protein